MMPKKVLIVGLTENKGGLESFIMDLYRRIDRSRIQFDFLHSLKGNKHLAYEDEILSLGGRVFYFPMLRDGPLAHYLQLNRIFKQTHYTAVYYQANYKIKNADVFRIAMKYHVPFRILHSHNSSNLRSPSFYQDIREMLAAHAARRYVTNYFCCSEAAGEWMFGKNAEYTVINNGIDTKQFDCYPGVRTSVRAQENLGNKNVYGTVARISPPKNPLFLVDVFNEIHKLQPNSVFLHIGGNQMGQQLQKKISRYNLEDCYLLLGEKDRVFEYLNAMDLFLLPSIHEGFPISLVEAQTSGLKCLVSDSITRDVDLTGNITFCSIAEPAQKWAEIATSLVSYQRVSCRQSIVDQGYDVQSRVTAFERLILSEGNGKLRT